MELRESFGETVRSIRRSKGLAQGEIGTNQGFISELESGLKAPTLPKIAEIAKKLGLHPITLLTATYETMGPENAEELLAKVTSELENLKQLKIEASK
ncbi:helix-turn-helix domain-containing protein [Pseudomonas fluorescens]|jgi:transcriptional regulator with XRE-family HTH domain|uniref:helix-turn-helix domain-containing protein n=1 Tax=Pseudomonas fluorescens TaxID=294 RepID=UPI000FA280FA|nr:helix-turn-helix transcriptional regulator [Pseudomonas fluorescens]